MTKKKIFAPNQRLQTRDVFFLIASVAFACVGLKGFLLPSDFLDGGVTGIALIARELTHLPLPWLILAINLPFVWMGWKQISALFALKTLGAIGFLSLALWLAHVPTLTTDPLLVSVFGGAFLGVGIGLAIRGGGVIDGTEVMALYISKYSPFTVGDVILVINTIIFLVAAKVFNLETALYAMLTYFCASRTVNVILHGVEEYVAMQIISERSSPVLHKVLTKSLKLKIITFPAFRGDPSRMSDAKPAPVLYTVVSRLQSQAVIQLVHRIDPKALIVHHHITDIERGPHV